MQIEVYFKERGHPLVKGTKLTDEQKEELIRVCSLWAKGKWLCLLSVNWGREW